MTIFIFYFSIFLLFLAMTCLSFQMFVLLDYAGLGRAYVQYKRLMCNTRCLQLYLDYCPVDECVVEIDFVEWQSTKH